MRKLYSLAYKQGSEFAHENYELCKEMLGEDICATTGNEVTDGFLDGILSVFEKE